MRILSRYVLREFLLPLTYCLVGFLGIYVIFELFESFNRLLAARPPFLRVVGYFAGYISPYMEWLIPAALMLGTLYTIWIFARHSEITAMRANGISFLVIVRPVLAVAAVMALAVACINEFYAPQASEAARDFRSAQFKATSGKTFENVPYYNQPANRVWRINRMSFDNPGALEGVRLSYNRSDGSRRLDITSRKAEYLDGMWWFHYPQYQYYDEFNMPIENPHPGVTKLPLRSLPELDETPRDFVLMNKSWEFYSLRDMRHYLKTHPSLTRLERSAKAFDIHAALAAPFSCLVITLFAIPAGIATGRQSVFKGVISAVAMFFGFYAIAILSMLLAKNGYVPAIPAAWSANAVFLVIGLILFHRQR